jgi:hypothetical protein
MDGCVNVYVCLAALQECFAVSAELGGSVTVADKRETFLLSLAVASAEGRVLAVSFLLGISADPNTLDRWQGSPMDDALHGGTLYHKYCAKLLQAWGGELARYQHSDEGEEFLEELQKISIKTVRLLISKLIEQGLDRTKPHRLGDQETLIVMSACVGHMDLVVKLKERVADITAEMSVLTQSIERCGTEVQLHLEKTLKVLETQARMAYMPEHQEFESRGPFKTRPSTGMRSIKPAMRTGILHDNLAALNLLAGHGNIPDRDTLRQSVFRTNAKPQRHNLQKMQSIESGDGDRFANRKVIRRSSSFSKADQGQDTTPVDAIMSSLLQTRSVFNRRLHIYVYHQVLCGF